jgi:hypothetical protein
METTGDDDQLGVGRSIDKTMGLVDAPRPITRQVSAQRLGLADSCERFARRVGSQGVDALECLAVLLLPGLNRGGLARLSDGRRRPQ